jgi:glycosyltransferase involved in cell wall biosynthesis
MPESVPRAAGDLPLLSVSIPTYRQEKYIGRAIESVLAQDYPNVEVVVSDDCSPDGTFDVASRYAGERVRVTRTPRNLGRVGNYRRCLYELATGDWAVNLDGDDYYDDPKFFSGAVEALKAHPAAVLYAAGSKAQDETSGAILPRPVNAASDLQLIDGTDYVLGWPELGATQHFSVIYNRPLALETGFYVLDSLGTDTDSLCRLALRGKVLLARKHVGVWTNHGQNASYSLEEAEYEKEIAMLRHIWAALREHVDHQAADAWLDERIRMKERFFTQLIVLKSPPREAWPHLLRSAKPDLFHAKEAVKLALRSVGLR